MPAKNHILKNGILTQFKVNEDDLGKLCREMGVRSLAVFGSVTQGEFKAGQSDIDFLVEFEVISADRFFDFLDGLKKLFHYDNVDLVTSASLKNHVIRQSILSSQESIYVA
ncbi:MAG: toxin-antitoxin system toxin subunit [Calothrix sp. SM1_5_4]|nr:toxin-antitoxin system toxin subunit [Calothrix sp. SM1_5_4]